MTVVDVTVHKATNITNVGRSVLGKQSFCVYVRLQGQAMRTKPGSVQAGEVTFNERFRFQIQLSPRRPEHSQLFVELWTKTMFSQSCVSVAWIDLGAQNFVQGQPLSFNVSGNFDGKSATVAITVVPIDFGAGAAPLAPPTQAFAYPQPPAIYQYQVQQPIPTALPPPADGIPLESVNPYQTGSYFSGPAGAHPYLPAAPACEPAPMPMPQPQPVQPGSLPPPLYPDTFTNSNDNWGQDAPQPPDDFYPTKPPKQL